MRDFLQMLREGFTMLMILLGVGGVICGTIYASWRYTPTREQRMAKCRTDCAQIQATTWNYDGWSGCSCGGSTK